MADDKKLTAKQRRFVDAYDGNATAAALAAGYSARTAQRIGSENLFKPLIAAAIRARETKRRGSLIATREERQSFWTATMRDERVEMKDRLKASELLGKSEADFIDTVRASGPDGGPLLVLGAEMTAEAARRARQIAQEIKNG
ncbi:terminase small subunit [Pyramidobacter sp. C12-8]|uniref:terminase small subunit n=1 Tax=Pyramidobacter sp. C12-8 TaxID=1943580 RepID=UPI0009C46D25|nr:terminase small subunit [Pyramidobacter sp. C12-8]OON89717.1 hypothetical protein B0D78_02500 [Pyramidobacter sp. C12-8]